MIPDRESRAEQVFAEALDSPQEKRSSLKLRCADDAAFRLGYELMRCCGKTTLASSSWSMI